jgi:hypothetical protein
MARDSNGEKPGRPQGRSQGHWDASPNAAEAWVLMDALLENRISDVDRKRLEQLVIAEPAIARMYLRVVHFWCSLPLHVGKVLNLEVMLDDAEADLESENALTDTMILPAIRGGAGMILGVDGGDDEPLSIDPPKSLPASTVNRPSRIRGVFESRRVRRGGLAAAIVILVGTFAWALWPKPAAAVLTATAAARLEGCSTSPGTRLSDGQAMSLSEGAVELTFNSGAVVVVAAPARFHIVDRNTLALDSGRLAAHVPTPAIGFRVLAPSLSVIDRGTNFGVRTTNADLVAEVDVFDGKVDATPLDSTGQPIGTQQRVIASQAVCTSTSNSATLISTPYVPDAFPRDITAIQMSLDWHGSGAGISPGAPDPQWTLASVPNDPDWTPQPAVVLQSVPADYPANSSAGRWIAVTANPPGASEGEYVYRTTVDMKEFNPATADVTAQVAVDQAVVDVKINGVYAAGTATVTDDPRAPVIPVRLTLPSKFWHKGVNQVEVVVKHLHGEMPVGNDVGLQLVWKAAASPIVRR